MGSTGMRQSQTYSARSGLISATALVLGLGACAPGQPLDWDLRPSNVFSTSDAARQVTATRPQPDARGVISYPGYQVVVAQRGDRVRDVAQRVGLDPQALARHNAIGVDAPLRGGEMLVLPGRVSEPPGGPITGMIAQTPLDPVTPLPGAAAGSEPLRHTVRRGETAFTIARLYNVSSRALADWNGLPADLSVREGQILIIPVAEADSRTAAVSPPAPVPDATPRPGQGSTTPVPPSASRPLPPDSTAAAGQGATQAQPPVANLGAQRTEGPRFAMPVEGRIIRAYQRGRNDGIGIGAPAGTQVRAAAAGTVAAITQGTDQVPILVIRHDGNLLTVYANIDNVRVERGARVTRGQTIATVRQGDPSFLHFEVRDGLESVDPMPYLQ